MKRREIERALRRDRRVLRRREVHRHAGQALLERHVRPARVLRRGAPRAGDHARRRGALGRRRGVPAALPRVGWRSSATPGGPSSSSRTRCRRSRSSATGRSGSTAARSSGTGRAPRSIAQYLHQTRSAGDSSASGPAEAAPGNDLARIHVGPRPLPRGDAAGRSWTSGARSGSRSVFRVLRDGQAACSRRSRSSTRSRRSRSTRWTRTIAGRRASPPGEYVATAWIPGNLLNEGLASAEVAICSIDFPKLEHHAAVYEAVSFEVLDPRRGRHGARRLRRPVARRRPAAARLDGRGARVTAASRSRTRRPSSPTRVGDVRGRLALYEEIGRRTRREILDLLPEGWSFEGKRVLDFGCGAGRTLRHFLDEAAVAEIYGCEIDAPSVAWLEANLSPPLHVFRNEEAPPLPLEADSFDLIWAISVFTHLTDHWADWLLEHHRLLRDGGLLIATILGPELADDCIRARRTRAARGRGASGREGGDERDPPRPGLGPRAARTSSTRPGGSRSTGAARSRSSSCGRTASSPRRSGGARASSC